MFFCSEVLEGVCTNWIQLSEVITLEDALTIGAKFLAVTASAWGLSLVARIIINR